MSDIAITDSRRKRRSVAQIALLSAGLLILIGISASSIYLLYSLREDADQIAHTLEVDNQIFATLLQIRRAESAERGYLITSQLEFLEDFREAEAGIRPALAKLRRLVEDNPQQIQLLNEAMPLVELRLREFNNVVTFTAASQRTEATRIVEENALRRTTARIREIADAMHREEELLLRQRTQDASKTQVWSALATISGSGAVLALALTSALLVQRSRRLRDEAQLKLMEMNTTLESAVAERTTDLQEANEEIQRFAYIVSHDLRSPLVNIMGFTSELEMAVKPLARLVEQATATAPQIVTAEARAVVESDLPEAIGFIRSSTRKMDRLINAILKLSREGRRSFNIERLDMDALVAGVVGSLHVMAQEKAAVVEAEGPLPVLYADRVAVEQLLSNLVENALKYLQPGRPGHVRIRGFVEGSRVIYEVEDNGRGIAPRDHERIFELFRRAGPQDQAGEGIGLAHVRALAYRLGGLIECRSELDRGSTFRLSLPRTATIAPEAAL
jgi:signal transduction histidine kinase